MKNLKMFSTIVAIALLSISCSQDVSEGERLQTGNSTLSVQISVSDYPVETRAGIKSVFEQADQVGLFITSGSADQPYGGDNSNSNNPLTYSSGKWTLGRAVYLSADNALIYGYYPYDASVNDITSVPVKADKQINYLYGNTGSTTINNRNTEVNLSMNHAISCVRFLMKKEDYPGTGKVTKIEIGNKAGKSFFYSQGTMDATTGLITPDKENISSVYIENTTTGLIPSLTEAFPKDGLYLLVLPVTVPTETQGDMVISITVDGVVYKWTQLPSATIWQAATTNTYQVTLKGSELVFGEDDGASLIIEPWDDEQKGGFDIS